MTKMQEGIAIPVFTNANMIYWLLITIAIAITTMTLGQLWRRQENYRWTTGYAIVFLPGAIMVWLGFWDLTTWIGLFFGVGISGAIKVGYAQFRKSKDAERLRSTQLPKTLGASDDEETGRAPTR